jgi:sterol desaturase/sphingolipid hydroxylase (fatty acid hydroxylase superfamily)
LEFEKFIITNETLLRLSFFFGMFAVMALWELVAPCRKLQVSRPLRWSSNVALVVVNSIVIRVLFPTAAAGVAIFAAQRGWGLFNILTVAPGIAVILSVVLLDLAIWFQHVAVHYVPILWRLHRVHHADLDFDVTTGARFHPLEIIFSMVVKFAVILLLGPPVVAVVIFEIILNATSMFNHSNIQLPAGLDRIVRWFMVTPDMHRVHHSVIRAETNSNFGFNLPWWDRLFGTYRAQPQAGHLGMQIGIPEFSDLKWCSKLPGMLWIPFISARDIASEMTDNREHQNVIQEK